MSKTRRPPFFTITQQGIGEILKSHRLKVPPNQREYSWTEKEVTRLFQDLAKAIADDEAEYFLGTIVTIPESSGFLEVIDGQQRLATITILLCNIRRYLMDKDTIIADDIKLLLTYTDREQRAVLNRLKLNNVDNDFFGRMISDDRGGALPKPTRRSHRLIRDAFENAQKYITKIVASYRLEDHGDFLNKWVTFIEQGAQVILLQVTSGANAYKMFETLNDRGLKTTQADLVKNYLFGQAGDVRLAEAQDSWSAMRGALETLQEEEKEDITVTFLRQALMAIRGFLRKDKVYEAVQERARGAQASISFLKDVEGLVETYVATYYRDHEKWKSYPDAMRLAVHTLNFFDIIPFRPVLLSIAAKYDTKEALKAYQMFISLGVRLLIASSTRSGSIEETLAEVANEIYSGKISTASKLKDKISSINPTDVQFQQAFEIATISKASLARYYLRAIERVAKKEPNPWFILNEDKEEITLEHVLPGKPGDNWPQFTDEQVESYWKRLGNMVLMPYKDNSDLKSFKFEIKASVYKNSPYALTAQVSKKTAWTVDAITERQKHLAKLALEAWPI